MSYKAYGTAGEKEVASLILCPNCQKELMTLPESFPLNDAQCIACNFRVQIKSSSSNPYKSFSIRGSGWDIMDKVLKAGYLIPPLLANYKWSEKGVQKQEIRFYPFLMKRNLIKRVAKIHGGKRIYNMFDYDVRGLPYMTLFTLTNQ